MLFDLGSQERIEPVPPVPHRLMADVDTALVEQILDVAQRKQKSNEAHDREAEISWLVVKHLKASRFSTRAGVDGIHAALELSSSDNTLWIARL